MITLCAQTHPHERVWSGDEVACNYNLSCERFNTLWLFSELHRISAKSSGVVRHNCAYILL